jgi:hypothetical protein
MSTGLIPIVPDIGGQVEFVPSKYHFHTFGEAIQIILHALNVDDPETVLLPIESLLSTWVDHGYQHLFHGMIFKNSKKELE